MRYFGMNLIIMNALMEKLGLQLMVIAVCAGASLSEYFLEKNDQSKPASEFVLVKESQNVKLYERWFTMKSGERCREIKVECAIKVDMEAALSLIQNGSKAKDWNKGASVYRILPQKDHGWVSYIQYKLPWPIDNQDCVLQNKWQIISEDFAVVKFKSIRHDSFPEYQRVERIPYVEGRWVFTQSQSVTLAEYYITTIPNSRLPRMVTDPIIRNNLISTIDNFRSCLEN